MSNSLLTYNKVHWIFLLSACSIADCCWNCKGMITIIYVYGMQSHSCEIFPTHYSLCTAKYQGIVINNVLVEARED